MADLATAGIAAMMTGANSLFNYNREAFIFERSMKQAMIHQEQAMRIEEASLYREDLRDLFDLVIKKMDSYLVINTLMLGFSISLFSIVEMPSGVPRWLFWLYEMCLCGSALFLLLSVWLALYASVMAQTYMVRLLTQWLRLPVPSRKDIERAASSIWDYERSGPGKFLRLPVIHKGDSHSDSSDTSQDDSQALGRRASRTMGSELNAVKQTHFKLFSELQGFWQGYDAYARVCMVMGSNQLLQALGHISLAYFVADFGQVWASILFLLVIHYCEYLHMQMNLSMDNTRRILLPILLFSPPALTAACALWWHFETRHERENGKKYHEDPNGPKFLAIFAFLAHMLWLSFALAQGFEQTLGLPVRFNTVGLANDILGEGALKKSIDTILGRIGNTHDNMRLGHITAEEKCLQIEEKIQKLFREWRSSDETEKHALLRLKFHKLRRYLRDIKGESGNHYETLVDPKFSNPSIQSSPSTSRSYRDRWVMMKVTDDSPVSRVAETYYLNPATGEIKLKLPEEDLTAYARTDFLTASSEGEKKVRAEMADFARFISELQDQVLLVQDSSAESIDLNKEVAKRNRELGKKISTQRILDTQAWRIYRQASFLIIIVWAIGVVWSAFHYQNDALTGEMKWIFADRSTLRIESGTPIFANPREILDIIDFPIATNGFFPISIRKSGDIWYSADRFTLRVSEGLSIPLVQADGIASIVNGSLAIDRHGTLINIRGELADIPKSPLQRRLDAAVMLEKHLISISGSEIFWDDELLAAIPFGKYSDITAHQSLNNAIEIYLLTEKGSVENWSVSSARRMEFRDEYAMQECSDEKWFSIQFDNGWVVILGYDLKHKRTILRRFQATDHSH